MAHQAQGRQEAVRVPALALRLLTLCRYNPVLGEFFRCRYDYSNGTQGFYIAEQGMDCARLHGYVGSRSYTMSLASSAHLCVLLHIAREPC